MKKFILMLLIATPLFAQNVGLPVSTAKNSYTIENTTYSLGFAGNYGIPVWEMHPLNLSMLSGEANVPDEWKSDSRVKGYRLSAKDIAGEKLVPVQLYPESHARNDMTAQQSSFLTSNLVFMNKQLRDTIWQKITYSFELLAKQYGTVFVYSGTIYDRDSLKVKYMFNNRIAIPLAFYRMVLYYDGGKPQCKCYRITNRIPTDYERNCDIETFACNLYQLEADADVDFFDRDIDSNFRQAKMQYLEKQVR
ncbi:MAG: DNA/RNA non-specific endonuclease [Treponema sp.]|nr:DNA/RNA non-specific endonuclease [Treponema sp.]